MTQVAEKPAVFASALDKRPVGGPRWLDDLRGRGAARFIALGIPTVRDEEWRFTNVAPIGNVDFQLAGPISGTADRLNGAAYADAAVRLVVVNGRFDTTLSRVKGLANGVHAGSLAAALKDHADVVQRYFGQLADINTRSFTALRRRSCRTARSSTCRRASRPTPRFTSSTSPAAKGATSWPIRARS